MRLSGSVRGHGGGPGWPEMKFARTRRQRHPGRRDRRGRAAVSAHVRADRGDADRAGRPRSAARGRDGRARGRTGSARRRRAAAGAAAPGLDPRLGLVRGAHRGRPPIPGGRHRPGAGPLVRGALLLLHQPARVHRRSRRRAAIPRLGAVRPGMRGRRRLRRARPEPDPGGRGGRDRRLHDLQRLVRPGHPAA